MCSKRKGGTTFSGVTNKDEGKGLKDNDADEKD
jgi:hypothetical protein